MDLIARFCLLPTRPLAADPGQGLVVLMPTSTPPAGTGYLLDRLGRDCILLFPPRATTELARPFAHQGGFCWTADLPDLSWCGAATIDDCSPLWLLEEGRLLGPAHTIHQRIAAKGLGRFSHWGRKLFFSASDNTDPNANGRLYQAGFVAPPELVGLGAGTGSDQRPCADPNRKAERYSWIPGKGGGIIIPDQCLESPLWARAETVVDLNPWGSAAWTSRKYLRRLGLRRLVFRQGLDWAEISLAPSVRQTLRKLAGQAEQTLGGLVENVFGAPEPGGDPGLLERTAGSLRVRGCRIIARPPGAGSQPARSKEVLGFFRRAVAQDNALFSGPANPGRRSLRLLFCISSLATGGAERSLSNLAGEARRRGHEVRVVTTNDPAGGSSPLLEYLEGEGVVVARAGGSDQGKALRRAALHPGLKRELLARTPLEFRTQVAELLGEIALWPPDALLSFLDQPNIIGGVAGFLGGVGRILFSIQSLNPSHFPWLDQPWLRDWYRILAASKRIQLTTISQVAAEDYQAWLRPGRTRIRVLPTGVDLDDISPPRPEERAAFRRELGVRESDFLVAGSFRLSPEKRPETFLEVIGLALRRGIRVKAVVAGEGPLEDRFRTQIRKQGLGERVFALGLRKDIFKVLGSCEVLLHTSEMEGLSQTLLEAQYLGLPVVCTDVGGTKEAVVEGRSGFLRPKDDLEGLADCLVRLARDRDLARDMGSAGTAFVAGRFSKEQMYDRTMELLTDLPLREERRES